MPLNQQDLATARRSMLLAEAAPETAARLLEFAYTHKFAARSVLFREGEKAQCIYVALDGLVGLSVTDERANQLFIEFVKPGWPFAIAPLLLDEPYAVNAEVVRSSRLLVIPGPVFRQCVATDLSFSNALNRLQSRLRGNLITNIRSLVTKTAAQRLAAFLLTLIEHSRGETTVTLPCERQALASWLGILPTSISRIFHQLEELGVEDEGENVTIKSVERLRKFSANRAAIASRSAVR